MMERDGQTIEMQQEQIDLYWNLFIHREDIFARYNLSRRTNKYSWGPAYEYGHDRNPKPIRLTKDQLQLHLNGIERLGTYSTLPVENSCSWVAADFDENSGAFEQCLKLKLELAKYEIPCFIERSNSGKGYHAFVFFKEPIQASRARRMMYGALHEAGIPLSGKFTKGNDDSRAIDRLFPCQDTVPANGFGNQISLPFYGKAVQQGNTLFIDDNEEVIPDQWGLLQNIYDNHRVEIGAAQIDVLASLSRMEESRDIFDQTDNNYFLALASLDGQLECFKEGCEAIKQSISNPNQFGNFAWVGVLSNIAVFGSKGRDLAHEVSKGYDMTAVKNDPKAVYTEEETDRVFFSKVNHIQKSGPPMSCKRLAEEGWECPRLKDGTCKAGFPVKYGAPPSFTIYRNDEPFSIKERLLIHSLEKQGLYDTYRSLFSEVQFMTDYRILAHLLALYDFKVTVSAGDQKSFCYVFENEEQAKQVASLLQSKNVPHDQNGKLVWMLRQKSSSLNDLSVAFQRILEQTDGKSLKDQMIWEDHQRIAPFFGKISEFIKYAGMGATLDVKWKRA